MSEEEKMDCSRCKGTGFEEGSDGVACFKCLGEKKLDWITNITGPGISRQGKAILYVIKTLNKFVTMGIMTGGALAISPEAEKFIEDFKPTEEETRLAIAMLRNEGYIK